MTLASALLVTVRVALVALLFVIGARRVRRGKA